MHFHVPVTASVTTVSRQASPDLDCLLLVGIGSPTSKGDYIQLLLSALTSLKHIGPKILEDKSNLKVGEETCQRPDPLVVDSLLPTTIMDVTSPLSGTDLLPLPSYFDNQARLLYIAHVYGLHLYASNSGWKSMKRSIGYSASGAFFRRTPCRGSWPFSSTEVSLVTTSKTTSICLTLPTVIYPLLFTQIEDVMLGQQICGGTQESKGNHDWMTVFFPDDVVFIGGGLRTDCMRLVCGNAETLNGLLRCRFFSPP